MPAPIATGIDWSAGSHEELRARFRWSIPERLNIAELACDRQEGLALIVEDEAGNVSRTTFEELRRAADRVAFALRELGVERGDRVAVLLPPGLDNAAAHLGAFKAGAVSVPLSILFRRDALLYRLGHGEVKVLFTDAEHLPHFREIEAELPQRITAIASMDELPAAASLFATADTSADDPAMLIYTSGTSGPPKGALHAHRFLPGRLSGFELCHRLSEPAGERPFYTPADWAWIGGLVDSVLTPWTFGRPVLAHPRRRFDPAAMLSLIERHRVRSLFLPPTAVSFLRAVAGRRVPVESVHTAGEPLLPETYALATGLFGTVYELYGMTEMGATIGCSPYVPVRPGSMGKPYPGHDVALIDEGGGEVPGGEIGEIAIGRGDPGMFLGYHRDPEATAERFLGDWFRTGDLARRDEGGYVFYQGRADDMFNSAGYRLGPTEIEQCLESHPAVERAAVIGAPDPERGAVVKAFVAMRPGGEPSDALYRELQRHVRDRLAVYQYPRRIVFVRSLPVTVTGKLRRRELREGDADERFGIAGFGG